jgi:hypothetical protein
MTDWAKIKAEWCAGSDSNVRIAKRHGVSEGAIRKYAKENRWEKGNPEKPNLPPISKSTPPPVAECGNDPVFVANSALSIAERMIAELDATTSLLNEIEDWIEEDTKDDNSPARRNAMLKAISLPSRAMTLKTIQQSIVEMQKVGKPSGKKAERSAAAKKAALGKFAAPPSPPKLSVVKS